jgi:hypothetical protein
VCSSPRLDGGARAGLRVARAGIAVRLSRREIERLVVLFEGWAERVHVDELPPCVWELRCAMRHELHSYRGDPTSDHSTDERLPLSVVLCMLLVFLIVIAYLFLIPRD